MTAVERTRFLELCEQDASFCAHDGDGIGTYNEKRFHRIFKRLITEDASCYEVKVGAYVADVLCGDEITEIQTGSFRSLAKKIGYYLENTDYTVTVVKPLITNKRIIRAERETGEVKSVRRSPKRVSEDDALSDVFYLREHLSNKRLTVRILLVSADEYRYSERVRYRKSGAYDSDSFPTDVTGELRLCGRADYLCYMPRELYGREFSTAEYGEITGLKGRNMYSALNILCALDALTRRKEGRGYIYTEK